MMMTDLKDLCRSIPDFPKKGILFRDITTLIQNGEKFKEVIDAIGARYLDKGIDAVVCIEARGFIIGAALAYKLGAGIIPVRKKGKLPWRTYQCTYELEYGTDTLEIHQDAIQPGQKVVIVDDLIATGGTAGAVINLVEQLKGKIVECAFLIELTDLKGREKIKGYPVFSLIQY
ncbi:MAG: adenine phosphoribosyltransferase [Chloroflexota bacterium]